MKINAKIDVKIKLGSASVHAPEYETDGSAGLDIRAAEGGTIAPFERKLISTGIYLEIPIGYEAQVRPRSGLAIKSGIGVLNSPGTIDSDYRGEVKVILINLSDVEFSYSVGDRIAQMVFAPVVKATFNLVDSLDSSERGSGGFGSTGVN